MRLPPVTLPATAVEDAGSSSEWGSFGCRPAGILAFRQGHSELMMTRITPRTCLWPLAISLCLTFALSFGLTFRSNRHCYAGTCGEWLFPLQARLHVAVWYCWLSISVTILAVRAFHPSMRRVLRRPLFKRKLPWIGKQLAVSGLLIALWVVLLYGVIVAIWWVRLRDYFTQRGLDGGVRSGNKRLAAIALTGHMCDVTMGMAIMPVSRHSALASFFKISVSTTLTFHMITAYALFTLVLVHGFLYVSWIPVFTNLVKSLRMVFPILNPTYLYHETWPGNSSSLGVWRASLIFTGIAAAFIFLLIFITTLPMIRSRHFNIFYFTHLLGIVAIVVICLHASTMLYCTGPGLMMWLLDWLMRLYELRASLDGDIKALGNGWYRLGVPLSRRRLHGCACSSPIAHFYIYHADSSLRELHPFTTITHLASQNTITHPAEDDIRIEFLFRIRNARPQPSLAPTSIKPDPGSSFFSKFRRQKQGSQWTERLAAMAGQDPVVQDSALTTPDIPSPLIKTVPVSLRLEGPYFTTADPARHGTVVCIVAGTGISGALAVAGAFKELERQSATNEGVISNRSRCAIEPGVEFSRETTRADSVVSFDKGKEYKWKRCIVVWSVREDQYIALPELQSSISPGLEVRIHLTGKGRKRLIAGDVLDDILNDGREGTQPTAAASTWVYISGPNGFVEDGEAACKKRQHRGVEWYGARQDI